MILDSGICSIFSARDQSDDGDMPSYAYTLRAQGWYGELSFETSPVNPTEYREERSTAARIRILQRRDIHEQDLAVLRRVNQLDKTQPHYRITRAWHGPDPDSGEPITDLTLEEVRPWS